VESPSLVSSPSRFQCDHDRKQLEETEKNVDSTSHYSLKKRSSISDVSSPPHTESIKSSTSAVESSTKPPSRHSTPIPFKEVLQQQLLQQLHERKHSAPPKTLVSSPRDKPQTPQKEKQIGIDSLQR
jgi:hypothetical protein